MNNITAAIPAKWKVVGVQLKLPIWTLDNIQTRSTGRADGCILSFEQVFIEWERQKTSPHTWETIINALRAPAVGEHELADRLFHLPK